MSNSPRSAVVRRNWGNDDSHTNILHVDMDSFFASVEILLNPSLRDRPLIVGGSSPRSVVTSATYDVRARGVRAGMPVSQARRLAPQAHVVCSGRSHYSFYSKQVMNLLASVTDRVEVVSVDEAFIDVRAARRRLGSPVQIAQQIRTQIRRQIGLVASVGVAATKSVAKIASSHAKPDGLLLIPQERTVDFLHCLPVGALWGVGKQTQSALAHAGVDTVRQLAHLRLSQLEELVGLVAARRLHELAWGIDPRQVLTERVEKSIGTEQTFSADIREMRILERTILAQAHECATRLRDSGNVAWTVSIKVRFADFKTVTRSVTLPSPVDTGRQIAQSAVGLLHALSFPTQGVRLLGVRVENLQDPSSGIPVQFDEDGRVAKAERVMDLINARFGGHTLRPARLVDIGENSPDTLD